MMTTERPATPWLRLLQALPLLLLVVLFAGFSLAEPKFASWSNVENILRQSSYVGIVAIGMTFVLLTAGIDLSVGAVMYFSAVVIERTLALSGGSLMLALSGALLMGALCGGVNGWLVARLRVVAFIATLTMLTLGRGLALSVTDSKGLRFPPELLALDSLRILGLPLPVVLLVAVALASQLVLARTAFGRHIYAIGNDPEAARKAGLDVRGVYMRVYVICGVMAALGGIVSITQIGVVNAGFGQGEEFTAVAAAVLGGTGLFGGRGSVFPGTVLGTLLIKTIAAGLIYTQVDLYLQPIVTAAIIFFAVLLDSLRNRQLLKLRRRRIRVEPVRA